jgi:hypothetical protein
MKRFANIDLNVCQGSLIQESENEVITTVVTLVKVTTSIYSRKQDKIISEQEVEYQYSGVSDGFFDPVIYWLVRGLHGIPLECRNEDTENISSDNNSVADTSPLTTS